MEAVRRTASASFEADFLLRYVRRDHVEESSHSQLTRRVSRSVEVKWDLANEFSRILGAICLMALFP